MRLTRLLSPILIALLIGQFLLAPNSFAALDDGYPPDQPAPGRTCPGTELGVKTISAFNGKAFICTLVNGVQKWWIEGDPIPEPTPSGPTGSAGSTGSNGSAGSSDPIGGNSTGAQSGPVSHWPPGFPHNYFLSDKAKAKMKIFTDVTYATDSPSQKLDIYMPIGVKNPPLVIWLHGGGFMVFDKDVLKYDDSAKILEILIANGIAVAGIDFRLIDEAKFPGAGQDTKSAIRYLRANASKYGYNPKKFAAWGESAGAYLALMAGATGDQKTIFDNPADPNIKVSAGVSAVIDLFGNANFRTMKANLVKYPCSANFGKTITVAENPWFGSEALPETQVAFDKANLYPYLKALKTLPAFYIFHGDEDCSVSKYESIELNKVLKSLHGKSSLTLVPGADHGGAKVWAAAASMGPILKKFFAGMK